MSAFARKGYGQLFSWSTGQNSEIQALFLRMRQAKDAATAFGEAAEFMEKRIPDPAELQRGAGLLTNTFPCSG